MKFKVSSSNYIVKYYEHNLRISFYLERRAFVFVSIGFSYWDSKLKKYIWPHTSFNSRYCTNSEVKAKFDLDTYKISELE